jgi:short-subunit dehydrogenase
VLFFSFFISLCFLEKGISRGLSKILFLLQIWVILIYKNQSMCVFNKIIWIIGASSKVGKALGITLFKQQCKLILSAINIASLALLKKGYEHPEHIKMIPLDLENYVSLASKAAEDSIAFGKIDILINHGDIRQRSLVVETNIYADKRIMDINYLEPQR